MKDHLQSSVRKLIGVHSIELSDKDVENFQKAVKGITFEAGTFEMAVAFIAIGVYDKAKFITERNRRETDLTLIADAFVYAYRNEGKSTISNLVYTKLKDTGLFANAVIFAEEFTDCVKLITPEFESATVH